MVGVRRQEMIFMVVLRVDSRAASSLNLFNGGGQLVGSLECRGVVSDKWIDPPTQRIVDILLRIY